MYLLSPDVQKPPTLDNSINESLASIAKKQQEKTPLTNELASTVEAFRAQNIQSAKSRLNVCAEDIREQLERLGNTSELCSQLGAVLGMLGDCCRALGDAASAATYFEESVDFLSKLPMDDLEVKHTVSVSLNKIGDLKYYDGDLQGARSYYYRSLDVRRTAIKDRSDAPSQTLDVAVSLAKVADVDRNLGNEDLAINAFEEAIKCLKSLTLDSNQTVLEHRRLSVLEFVQNQLAENTSTASV
ncbi:protein NCA1-like [Macadamia integrifolia]|uniref:protein NCA1-like n=1 Tax=Macadamia integrifolia TaxID=60698 RepID=UPI001C4EDBCE|nr:protein NCA1-like [Macadamia integrifolia]